MSASLGVHSVTSIVFKFLHSALLLAQPDLRMVSLTSV